MADTHMLTSESVNRKRLVDTFIALIKINSPSFQEEELGEVLVPLLERAGCDVEVQMFDKSFNLMVLKKGILGDVPPLLLSAHMDTIEPTEGIDFSVDDKFIRSTGKTVLGADDKSAIAQIIEALTVLHEWKLPHGDIEIALSSIEEKGLFGAKNLDFSHIRSKHALVLDSGGNVGKLVVKAPTHLTYEIHVTGKSAHAGIEPEKGISAIRVAARIIEAVPDGRISGDTTANIGMIRGGTATNVVPREAVIHGEIRSLDNAVLENNRKVIFETAAAVAQKNNATIRITEHEEYRTFAIEESDPFLKFLGGVVRKCGINPVLVETGGGSDANILNQHGIKAINMSTGMQQVHSSEEHIAIKDLYDGCRILLQTIVDFQEFKE